jgi:hypothetical protein
MSTNSRFREWSVRNAHGDLFHSEKTAARNFVVKACEKQSGRLRGDLTEASEMTVTDMCERIAILPASGSSVLAR